MLAQRVGIDTASPELRWQHINPVTGDGKEANAAGTLTASTHLDPDMVDVGESDPATWAAFDPSIGGSSGGAAIEDSVARLMSGNGGLEERERKAHEESHRRAWIRPIYFISISIIRFPVSLR